VPGGTVDETFASRPAWQRDTYQEIIDHLRALGPVHEDAVRVGVFLKHRSKIAEVRPMATMLALLLVLPAPVEHPLVSRYEVISSGRYMHRFRLRDPADIDDQIRDWLALAYDTAG